MKELVLELPGAFVCAEDFRLHFLELRRDESFAAYGRLLAGVMRRHIRKVRFGHFNEITEHGIVTHFERLDSGGCNLALL